MLSILIYSDFIHDFNRIFLRSCLVPDMLSSNSHHSFKFQNTIPMPSPSKNHLQLDVGKLSKIGENSSTTGLKDDQMCCYYVTMIKKSLTNYILSMEKIMRQGLQARANSQTLQINLRTNCFISLQYLMFLGQKSEFSRLSNLSFHVESKSGIKNEFDWRQMAQNDAF